MRFKDYCDFEKVLSLLSLPCKKQIKSEVIKKRKKLYKKLSEECLKRIVKVFDYDLSTTNYYYVNKINLVKKCRYNKEIIYEYMLECENINTPSILIDHKIHRVEVVDEKDFENIITEISSTLRNYKYILALKESPIF